MSNNTSDDLTIDIANLKRGMYIVQVSSDTVNSFQKIVIEK
ncbi:MAG: T9SS type A sorting domain-containing protein [Bacteroidetes bacterium]|nr:T9SS type A sorting domain-containing protein [Bacteroidota bacterium]